MAHYQVTAASLTPTRPAPAAPIRRDVQNVLSNSGYGSSFSVGTSSPSGSSYAASYSGIGGSPNRNSDMLNSSNIVRCGMVTIKEDGIVSWLWRPKWLVLKEATLSIHKSEVSVPAFSFYRALAARGFVAHLVCALGIVGEGDGEARSLDDICDPRISLQSVAFPIRRSNDAKVPPCVVCSRGTHPAIGFVQPVGAVHTI